MKQLENGRKCAYNNSRAQHAVLTKHLGVRKVFCVVGFSMGGQQVIYFLGYHSVLLDDLSRRTTGRSYFLTL